jgi:hypothetical protein
MQQKRNEEERLAFPVLYQCKSFLQIAAEVLSCVRYHFSGDINLVMKDNKLTVLLIAITSLELCILGVFLQSFVLIMAGIIINIFLIIRSVSEPEK